MTNRIRHDGRCRVNLKCQVGSNLSCCPLDRQSRTGLEPRLVTFHRAWRVELEPLECTQADQSRPDGFGRCSKPHCKGWTSQPSALGNQSPASDTKESVVRRSRFAPELF